MKVLVKPVKGAKFEVEFDPDILVKELKEQIGKIKTDMPADLQKLIHFGKIMDDEKSVKDYGVKDGASIVVMVSKAKDQGMVLAATSPSTSTLVPERPTADASTPTDDLDGHADVDTMASEETVQHLMQMGFERSQVERCLSAAFGSPDRAVDYLMNGVPELDGDDSSDGEDDDILQGLSATPTDGILPEPTMPNGDDESDEALPSALVALRENPMFGVLAAMVRENPAVLQQMLPALAESHPGLLQAIEENPDTFQSMLREADTREPGEVVEEGLDGDEGDLDQQELRLTEDERNAIQRLMELGFVWQIAVQAYLACGKNEEYAANYLFEQSGF